MIEEKKLLIILLAQDCLTLHPRFAIILGGKAVKRNFCRLCFLNLQHWQKSKSYYFLIRWRKWRTCTTYIGWNLESWYIFFALLPDYFGTLEQCENIMEPPKNTTRDIIASQNQDYVDEGLAEYQDQIQKLQCKFLKILIFVGKNSDSYFYLCGHAMQ